MTNYDYKEWQFSEIEREDGHMVVDVAVYANDVNISKIDLVFDTGAYITVVSRETARKARLPLGMGIPAKLQGFSNEQAPIAGELIEVPRIMLGKHFVYDVKVAVPLEDIAVAEVLGENVLEYFNYTVDHEKDVIYFKKNPKPKPYINVDKGIDLSCGKVLLSEA